MAVIPAAALGAILGAAMPYGKRVSSRPRLRGTSKRMSMGTYRRTMRRRGRYRKMSKRQWQAKARRMVGNPKNYSTAKTTESINPANDTGAAAGRFVTAGAGTNTKTIGSVPLIRISGTSNNSIDARQRDMCVVSGVKIHATFKNQVFDRIYINWGIIHGKQGQLISAATQDFFRDYQSERTFNASHTGKTGLTSSVAEINTDEFVVLKRGKFMLTPGTGSVAPTLYNSKDSTKEVQCWCKLGRSFYFDDSTDQPQDQIYFVWWPSIPEEPSVQATNLVCNAIIRSITYWREPRTA